MNRELSIQEVADKTGLSVHTLRYYERIGLMEPVPRAANGHRKYRENDLEWITLLLRLRATNMPISEMKRFADLVRQGDSTVPERRKLLEAHERKRRVKLREIQNTLSVLQDKISRYRSWEAEQNEEG